MHDRIHIDDAALTKFCERNGIQSLSFFGSVLRDDFTADSDVDVLVQFHPERTPGFLALAAMERELSELLGHKADMRTPNDLSCYFRDDEVREAQVLYVA